MLKRSTSHSDVSARLRETELMLFKTALWEWRLFRKLGYNLFPKTWQSFCAVDQSGKYHYILYIPVWEALHVNPTFAMCFVLCTIRTCNVSAPWKFTYTVRAVCAKNKQTDKKNTAKVRLAWGPTQTAVWRILWYFPLGKHLLSS